jgi:NAD(P)-dependent dehydrogenase (short-subunit alcohol dehydrogenase family)
MFALCNSKGRPSSIERWQRTAAQLATRRALLLPSARPPNETTASNRAARALDQITEEAYDREFDINVKGVLFTVQKALPLLREGASIILNASIVASKGLPGVSVYSATKAALRSFARTWTTDLKGRNVRVNVVSPGPIDTPGLHGLHDADSQQLDAIYAASVPLGRVGKPDDIAKAVTFLASDDSSFITGIELFVDGGMAQV